MNKGMKIAGGIVAALALGLGGVVVWANMAVGTRLAQTFTPHTVELQVPTPLTEAEIVQLRIDKKAELDAAAAPTGDVELGVQPDEPAVVVDPLEGVDLNAIALERAEARGKHLVEARFACVECHGRDFSGGVMVDDGAMGTWLGPNLTPGKGSRTLEYTPNDYDNIVRHGVKKDGTPAIMPSEDFMDMSDRELSDIIAYLGTFPAIDNEVPAPTFGPIGTMLMATGKLPLSAEHAPMDATHKLLPPQTAPTAEFGKHLSQVCTGCHRADMSGGPIQIGPPDWPPSGNLTRHEDGLKTWTFEQFDALMRTGKRPDDRELLAPMTLMLPYAKQMTDVEMQALWAFLQSLPPTPTGE